LRRSKEPSTTIAHAFSRPKEHDPPHDSLSLFSEARSSTHDSLSQQKGGHDSPRDSLSLFSEARSSTHDSFSQQKGEHDPPHDSLFFLPEVLSSGSFYISSKNIVQSEP